MKTYRVTEEFMRAISDVASCIIKLEEDEQIEVLAQVIADNINIWWQNEVAPTKKREQL